MRARSSLVLLVATSLAAVAASRVGAQTPQGLSLPQAVALALERSPQVRAARSAAQASAAQLAAARAAFWPSVNLGASSSLSGTGMGYQVSAGVTYLLYDGGVREAQVRQLEAQARAAQQQVLAVEAQVALAAVQAFMNTVRSEQVIALRQQVVEQARLQVEGAQARVRAGTAARADVVAAEAQLAAAEVQLLEAQAEFASNREALRALLGMEITAPLTLTAPGTPPPFELPEQEVVQRALTRPEVRRAEADVAAAEAALAVAMFQGGVTVTLDGRYVLVGTGVTPPGTWSVGASLSLPLVDGGQRHARVEAARANLEAARASLEQTRLEARRDAVQARLAYLSAAAREQGARRAAEAAAEALRVARGRYQAGVGSVLEVATAQTQFATVQESLLQAQAARWTSLATLRRAVGMPVLTEVAR